MLKITSHLKHLAQQAQTAMSSWPPAARAYAPQIVECGVYIDPLFRTNAAILPCDHTFCAECIQDGLTGMFRDGNEPIRCCGAAFPYAIVRDFGNLNPSVLSGYESWFEEFSAPGKKLYCFVRSCSAFIPKYLIGGGVGRCAVYASTVCTTCKKAEHPGTMCKHLFDSRRTGLKKMMKQGGWKFCPGCNHLVERIDGCKNMVCVCGARFCYRCGKRQEAYGSCCCMNGSPWDRMP